VTDKRDEATVVGQGAELLERMTDAFIALDRDWRIVYMNTAARTVGEPTGPEVIGRSHWEQWPSTVGTEVERQYRHAMETQKPVHFEHHYMVPGRDYWHSIHAYPDANGLSIFFRDVTEQKRSDDLARLLANASARFVSTLDQRAMLRVVAEMALPLVGDWACVYLVDDTFHVTHVDTAAVDTRELAILRQVVAQLPVAAVDRMLPWNRAMQRGRPVLLEQIEDGFYLALGTPELRDFVAALAPRSILCVPLMARGRTIGGITFGRSATSRPHDDQDVLAAQEVALPAGLALDTARLYEAQRQATHDAEDARKRAEDANLSKLDFLRAMSHEMRTPLNAIGGYVQLLRMGARGDLPDEVTRDLDRIERNYEHVTRLINDVLHFAKLDAGRVVFEPTHVSVAQMLDELEDFVAPQVRTQARRLKVRPCAPDVHVWADAGKARQILVNLVSNALKHTPDDTTIEVFCAGTSKADARVRICVRDDGPGISPDKQERIFEPFVQVGRTLNHPVEGLGLGLAIARDLARGMGGELSVESEPGKATTFTLALRPDREQGTGNGESS
jgi:PAS domain S-box-containing protein